MQTIGLWQIGGDDRLTRIVSSEIDLEKKLENWIEGDPSLVQTDLVIVARQVTTAAGRLDLLGIDPQGRWTVVEIKRGDVTRDTIAQALDYAAVIADMSESALRAVVSKYLPGRNLSLDTLLAERDAMASLNAAQREIAVVLVGTGRSSDLDRVSGFLANRCNFPLSVVAFDVFRLPDGSLVLARNIAAEPEGVAGAGEHARRFEPADVLDLATNCGTGREFQQIYEAAMRVGLYARTWKTSIMYTSPEYRTQMLFTVWAKPESGSLKLWLSHESFTDFYPTTEGEVAQLLGAEGKRHLGAADVESFVVGLERLFAAMKARSMAPAQP